MRGALVPILLGFALVSGLRASEIHVERTTRFGGASWVQRFDGSLSGSSTIPTGAGTVSEATGSHLVGEGTVRLQDYSLDFSFLPLKQQTTASGLFAFNGETISGTAGLDFRADILELVVRRHILERPRVNFDLMAGARLIKSDIEVFGNDFRTVVDDTYLLPELGASLRVGLMPRLDVFAVVKYFDYARSDARNHTFDATAGLSYRFPPIRADSSGLKGTLGYRTLRLRSATRIGEQRHAAFDVTMRGPYAAFGATF